MRRALTFTTVAAGGAVAAGAALLVIAGHGDGRVEPLLAPNDPAERRNGAPRPVPVPAERVVRSLHDLRAPTGTWRRSPDERSGGGPSEAARPR